MDKTSAKDLINKTFVSSFNKERFVFFIKNLLNKFEEKTFIYRGNTIPTAYQDSIKTLERIGKYKKEDKKIDILIVQLKKEHSLERARSQQRNFISWYLKSRGGALKDGALVAFVSPNEEDWRFSFVKMEYKFDKEKKKIKEDWTPARRYSFLVGTNEKSHTAQSSLFPLLENDHTKPTLEDLEKAFSVEKVTKEFYEKYRDLFYRLTEALQNIIQKDQKIREDFKAKKVKPIDFSKKLLGQIVFLYFLQKKGWFGVKKDEKWGFGSKHFLRELFNRRADIYKSKGPKGTKNFFNDILEALFYEALSSEHAEDYYSHFDCRIPFLNGGLFAPIKGYDWIKTDILLPDSLFSNKNKTKEGDIGDGILDIFDRYNFTVKEDEPLEKEVAVDPEMLGKVFENLLEVKDRKSKGTYYTPREIVHYMCQESLINYLTEELKGQVHKEDIEVLVHHGESVIENESHTATKNKETKTYSFKLPQAVRNQAELIDKKLMDIRICDPAVGSGAFPVGMMNEIIKVRSTLSPFIKSPNLNNRSPYHFKRHAIENCLYGVDIDSGAIEIAQLRLWLSLIVDEEEREKVRPLPNLDYKMICGNSLLSVEQDLFNQDQFNQLEKLKPLYFNETSSSKKQEYKKQIDNLISEITNGHKTFDFEVYFSEVFHEKKGFDVVIANPPYDVIKDKNYRKIYKEVIYGRANLYGLFIAKSLRNIVKCSGHIAFINPKTLLADKYFRNLRLFLKRSGCFKLVLKIIDRHRVFEQVLQSVMVYIFQKKELPLGKHKSYMKEIQEKSEIKDIKNRLIIDTNKIWLEQRFDHCILISNKKAIYTIFDKVINNTKSFLEAGIEFKTGRIQWDVFKENLTDKLDHGNVRLIWAENIQRYQFKDSEKRKGKEFIKGPIDIQPNINSKTIIVQRTTADEQKYRIISTIFDPDIEGFKAFSENHTNYLSFNKKSLQMEYILGLLNSKLFDLIFRHINSNTCVSSGDLNSLPIKDISFSIYSEVSNYVDKIINLKKAEHYLQNPTQQAQVQEYERQIDQIVYDIYNLTPKEIKIVEDS